MSFKVEYLPGNIIHLKFKDRKTLCRYMVRMEEFYESPKFQNQVFELADYIKWYTQENGQWSYYSDWSGFNIPGNKIKEFRERFIKLRGCEKEILQALPNRPDFYLIATYGDNAEEVIKHERAHAKFYLDTKYKAAMTHLVNGNKEHLIGLMDWILKSYNESVLIDECQAYMCTSGKEWFKKKGIDIPDDLVDIFEQEYKELM